MTAALNLIVSIVVIGGLVAVCRFGYMVAAAWFEEHVAIEGPSEPHERERLAA